MSGHRPPTVPSINTDVTTNFQPLPSPGVPMTPTQFTGGYQRRSPQPYPRMRRSPGPGPVVRQTVNVPMGYDPHRIVYSGVPYTPTHTPPPMFPGFSTASSYLPQANYPSASGGGYVSYATTLVEGNTYTSAPAVATSSATAVASEADSDLPPNSSKGLWTMTKFTGIEDYKEWVSNFTSDKPAGRVANPIVFHSKDDPTEVSVLEQWEDEVHAVAADRDGMCSYDIRTLVR